MKRVGLYIFSFVMLAVYALSLNRSFMEWWADFRTYTLHAPHTRARYGDLYSNCFLPGYTDTAYIPLKEYETKHGKTDLYILHDSYLTDKLKKENFIGVNKLVTEDYRDAEKYVTLDTSKTNILIIECSERTAEWRLTDTATMFARIKAVEEMPLNDVDLKDESGISLLDRCFNPNINQNLEFSLYDYEWFRPVKELKAQINFSLFGRMPKEVTVSTNKYYLLLSETVDPELYASSFKPLNSSYEDWVIYMINVVYDHYKSQGFDEVYFSIIPNPVSIVDAQRMPYNHKIEVLENHPSLYAPYISMYFPFKNSYERIYRRDDSHWNGNGIQVWVDEVNKRMEP